MKAFKLRTDDNNSIPLKVVQGHFATNHSHVNYFIDLVTLKTRVSEAEELAESLISSFMTGVIVDTIICLDGTQVIGTLLAQQLSQGGFHNMNQHSTIYVVTPEYNTNSQMVFRDNIVPMVYGKNVLILNASVSTGITVKRAMESVAYYGGNVSSVCAIFSSVSQVEDVPVNAVFGPNDVPDYATYSVAECPMCKAGQKIEALVNAFGYQKM